MDRHPARRSGLFLLELILAILFFILASTVCVRLFVKSHTLEQDSANLDRAVNIAVSIAEVFQTQDNPVEILDGQLAEDDLTVTFTTEESGDFLLGVVEIWDGSDLLYKLELKKFIGEVA